MLPQAKSTNMKINSFPSKTFSSVIGSIKRLFVTSQHQLVVLQVAYEPEFKQKRLEGYRALNQKFQDRVHLFYHGLQRTVVQINDKQPIVISTPQKGLETTSDGSVVGEKTRGKLPKWSDLHLFGAIQSTIRKSQACINRAQQKRADYLE